MSGIASRRPWLGWLLIPLVGGALTAAAVLIAFGDSYRETMHAQSVVWLGGTGLAGAGWARLSGRDVSRSLAAGVLTVIVAMVIYAGLLLLGLVVAAL